MARTHKATGRMVSSPNSALKTSLIYTRVPYLDSKVHGLSAYEPKLYTYLSGYSCLGRIHPVLCICVLKINIFCSVYLRPEM
jgi:hypothetical protein